MASFKRWSVAVVAIATMAGALHGLGAQQTEIQNDFKFNVGQDIQPIFDGWSRRADGTFNMHFGYLNRNWVEQISLPVGPANNIEPGGPDHGQPTFFYKRTNRNAFMVNVPKDWGKKELIWTVTANGKTNKAYGWLQPEWEIDPIPDGVNSPVLKNSPPKITVEPTTATVTLPGTLALNANVTDDGLPKPPAAPRKPAIGQEEPEILKGGTDAPVNVPEVSTGRGRGRGATPPPAGPTVSWIVWRGPAVATFSPSPVKEDKAQTTVTFTKPGDYVIRARATDRALTTTQDIKVTVK